MVSRFLLAGTAVTALAGLAGCTSEALNFCVESAKASCQVQYQCCTATERAALFGGLDLSVGPYSDEGGCVDALTRQCEAATQAQDEAISEKRLTFDAERAQKCLDDRKTAAGKCDANAIFNTDDNCAQLFKGAVDDGGKCTSDQECKQLGSQCVIDAKPTPDGTFVVALDGTCKGKGDAGEPCFPDGQCNQGLRCAPDATTGEQLCQPPAAAGDTCNFDEDCQAGLRCTEDATFTRRCTAPGDVGASCTQDLDCLDTLRCLQNDQGQQQCAVPGVAGSSCNSNNDCVAALVCATPPNDFQQRCLAVAQAGDECPGGSAQCAPGLECRFDPSTNENRCFAGAQGDPCDFGSRCQPGLSCRLEPIAGQNECLPPLAANQPCNPDDNPPDCAANLRCRLNASFQDVCQPPLAADAVCQTEGNSDPCDADHHCVFDGATGDNTCQARLTAGATCFADTDCAGGLFCDRFNTGVCVGLKAAGQACSTSSSTNQCQSGLTCRQNDAQTGTICRAPSAEGGGCQQLADCAPGLDCRFDDDGIHQICRGASSENGRCDSPADCGAGLDCRTDDAGTGTVCRGLSDEGGRCDSQIDCAAGLSCKTDPSTFQPVCLGPAVAGDACTQDADCDTDLVCRSDPQTGEQKCRALGAPNDGCTQDQDCQPGLRCRDVGAEDGVTVCTDLQDDGSPCQADSDCVHGHCDLNSAQCGEAAPKEDFQICDGI